MGAFYIRLGFRHVMNDMVFFDENTAMADDRSSIRAGKTVAGANILYADHFKAGSVEHIHE